METNMKIELHTPAHQILTLRPDKEKKVVHCSLVGRTYVGDQPIGDEWRSEWSITWDGTNRASEEWCIQTQCRGQCYLNHGVMAAALISVINAYMETHDAD
jgi:hypothetical protein